MSLSNTNIALSGDSVVLYKGEWAWLLLTMIQLLFIEDHSTLGGKMALFLWLDYLSNS